MVGTRVVADAEHQVAVVKILQFDGAFTDANRLRQPDAGRLMTHIRAVGEVVGAIFAGKELPEKRRFVGGTTGGVKLHAIWIVIALQQRANLLKRGLPLNRLIGVALSVIFHRVG